MMMIPHLCTAVNWDIQKGYIYDRHLPVMGSDSRNLVILIDGDIIEPKMLGLVLDEANKYGTRTICNIYGNSEKISYWSACIQHHGIKFVPNYTDGKNAADITMIVDAMDILYSKTVSGFCLVASDNHFAGLAKRICKEGMFLAGIGNSNTPASLRDTCDSFTAIEFLCGAANLACRTYREDELDLILKIKDVIDKLSAQKGGEWIRLSLVADNLSEFDVHAYCHSQLMSIIKFYPREFEIQDGNTICESSGDYVRIKR